MNTAAPRRHRHGAASMLGLVGFLFFLGKGLVWLTLGAAAILGLPSW
jgi:hypothetical protein